MSFEIYEYPFVDLDIVLKASTPVDAFFII